MQYEIISRPRHLRYLFFVEENYNSANLFKLFNENMHYWGGRVNPIIPITNNEIHPNWKQLIRYLDPDYIMHTANVSREFIKKMCGELNFHPAGIMNLDESFNRIQGMDCYYLLPLFERKLSLLKVEGIYNLKHGLRNFYRLNYLLDEYSVPKISLEQENNTCIVKEDKLKDLNQLIYESKAFNKSILSGYNLNTRLFRSKSYFTIKFELIIARDESSFEDYIYFWNRRLFSPRMMPIPNVIVTIEQLEKLMEDQWFKAIIKDFPVQNWVPIVSFSLNEEELKEIKERLSNFTEFSSFQVDPKPQFPYDIMDARGIHENEFGEETVIQIANSQEFHFQTPKLSFPQNKGISNAQNFAMDLKFIEVDDTSNAIKFPLTTDSRLICNTSGRVNAFRDLTLFSSGSSQSTLKIKIAPFFYRIQQLITRPFFIDKKEELFYSECGYSDTSYKLREFLKLFKSNFSEIESFIYDKFWADLFYELTTSIKTEGDTITFSEIFTKSENIFTEANTPLGKKGETYRNSENLQLGLTKTLQQLCELRVFLTGYNLKCRHCSSKIWYSIEETKHQLLCKGCFNTNYFQAESPIAYKLNHLIKNNIGMLDDRGKFQPNGNMTVIKTLLYLQGRLSGSFEYLPQIDVYKSFHSSKPETDIDIVCTDNGMLYIGECKHDSSLFKGTDNWKSLNSLAAMAEKIQPDKIILACTINEHDRLENAKIELTKRIQHLKIKPEILTYKTREPNYFDFGDYRYFLH